MVLQPRRIVQLGGQSLAGYLAASCGFICESESVDGNGDPQLERSNTTHHGGTRTHDPESNEPTIDDTSTSTTINHQGTPKKTKTATHHQPTLDTARDPSYSSPRVGGGIRSEVTRLRIGRGASAIGVLPSLDEANIPSGWGGVGSEVISSPIGRGEHSIWLGRSRP